MLHEEIRRQLNKFIVPSPQPNNPLAPNFFLHVKGPGGSLKVVYRQVCYEGALGVRAMHHLQSYGQSQPVYDGKAYSITCSYLPGSSLSIYTTHITRPTAPGCLPEYYLNKIRAFNLTDDAVRFRAGLTVFRNARDWTETVRENFINEANSRRLGMPATMPPPGPSSSQNVSTPTKRRRAESVSTKEVVKDDDDTLTLRPRNQAGPNKRGK